MKIFNKFKNKTLSQNTQKENETKNQMYMELGILEPFTLLVGSQFNKFVGSLADNKLEILNEIEQKAFDVLWNAACIDIDGFGNNIWNLKKGIFEIYNKNNVIVKFEKKSADVKDKYGTDEGRANFAYISPNGNIIINQNERNKKVFLVYVSENISERLVKALRNAEIEALDIETLDIITKQNIGIPKLFSTSIINAETDTNIDNTEFIINNTNINNRCKIKKR